MIQYLIEFALLHTIFLLVFRILLAHETQLRFLRSFLIGTTLLGLSIPLVEIPSAAAIPTINLEPVVLSTIEVTAAPASGSNELTFYQWVFIAICGFFLVRFIYGFIRIAKWYHQSELDTSFEVPIRKVDGIRNSFTFFKWIFIDPSYFENPSEIINHESGHSRQLHTLDVLLFNLLIIPFWCVPSLWIAIREIKKIHEYEADQFALRSTDQSNYIKTLVHSTLKAHGLNLASSFDDAPTVKRLNFMKKMKKRISPWKVGSVMAIVLISGAMFACEEEFNTELQRIVEESNQQFVYTPEVEQALYEAQQKHPGVKFAVIETLIENEESIKRLTNYDPDQIEAMFVYKDGSGVHEEKKGAHGIKQEHEKGLEHKISEDHDRVVLIIRENSELFEKTMALHKSQDSDKVFTIVEETASYPGGINAWHEYLLDEMEYPKDAQMNKIEGNVFVQFIVEKDGSLSSFEVLKGISPDCDKEAVRMLKNSIRWTPAKVDGKAVRMKMVSPFKFQL